MPNILPAFVVPFALAGLCAPALAQFTTGPGTVGSGGYTPRLSSGQPWIGRSNLTLQIDAAFGGSVGILVMGFSPATTTIGGLPLYVDPASVVVSEFVVLGGSSAVPGAGTGSLALPLTNAGAAFIGLHIFAQAALIDPVGTGFGGGWTASNGLELQLTSRPQLFAASSVGGNADPHWAVNGLSQTLDFLGGSAFTDNVDGAVYSTDGLDLYVSSGFGQLAHADLRGSSPAWSWLNSSIGSTGVAWDNCWIDRDRQLLWMMGQLGTVELLAIDIDQSSSSYGQVLHSTNTLSATVGLIGVFGMNNSRTLAAVPGLLGGSLHLVDTDPASATFLQVVTSSVIPPSTQFSPLTLNVRIRFSTDDLECYVLIQNAGTIPAEVARFLVPAGIWLDHDPNTPAIDHIGPMASPPVPFGSAPLGFDVGRDGSIYVTGWGGAGFAGRVTLAGTAAIYAPLNATSLLTNARHIALNRDQDMLAVAVANPTTSILLFDAATLNEIGAVSLGATVDTTVLVWR